LIIAHLEESPDTFVNDDVTLQGYHFDAEWQAATLNFSVDNLINGEGSFGPVFRGTFGAKSFAAAIKQMRKETTRNLEQLRAELQTLQKCRHPH